MCIRDRSRSAPGVSESRVALQGPELEPSAGGFSLKRLSPPTGATTDWPSGVKVHDQTEPPFILSSPNSRIRAPESTLHIDIFVVLKQVDARRSPSGLKA